jgi:hypothetical protein
MDPHSILEGIRDGSYFSTVQRVKTHLEVEPVQERSATSVKVVPNDTMSGGSGILANRVYSHDRCGLISPRNTHIFGAPTVAFLRLPEIVKGVQYYAGSRVRRPNVRPRHFLSRNFSANSTWLEVHSAYDCSLHAFFNFALRHCIPLIYSRTPG